MSVGPKSPLNLNIAGFFTLCTILIGSTWVCANYMRDLKSEVSAMSQKIEAIEQGRFTTNDMERWTFKLERANRERGLIVPEVRP